MKNWLVTLIKRTKTYYELESKLFHAETRAIRAEEQNRELDERVHAISERLCKVSVQRHESDPLRRLRICLEIDPVIIETGFLHGNDSAAIEMIGRQIGAMAANEIKRANFQRWER